jgi:hypothetical protein
VGIVTCDAAEPYATRKILGRGSFEMSDEMAETSVWSYTTDMEMNQNMSSMQ